MTRIVKSLSAGIIAATIALPARADDTKPAVSSAEAAAAAPAVEHGTTPAAEAKPASDAAAPAKPAAEKKETSAADEVAKVFPVDGEEWIKDPFLVLGFEMEAVVEDFKDGKSKPPAQTTQPRIISRFDAVIEMLEKKQGSGAGGGLPNKPADRSTLAKGPGGMGELRTPKKTGKGYDDLTPKEREKILQSKTEGFPPGFEDVLADYYRRLAKADGAAAEPAAESAAAAKPEAAKPDTK